MYEKRRELIGSSHFQFEGGCHFPEYISDSFLKEIIWLRGCYIRRINKNEVLIGGTV